MTGAAHPLPAARLLRERAVLEVLPISRSTWWRGVRDGRYPRPIRLGPRSVAWRARDIEMLIEQLAAASGPARPVLAASEHDRGVD